MEYEEEEEEATEILQKQIGAIATCTKFAFINKYGGTGLSDWSHDEKYIGPAVTFEITKIWYDYECGIRMHGKPLGGQKELEAYLDRMAFKGDYLNDDLHTLVPGDSYKIYVSQFDLK